MKESYINARVSDNMKSRINWAFEQEGIDWTSIIKCHLYSFVEKVEAGEDLNIEPNYFKLDCQKKNKSLQIRLTKKMKDRLKAAVKKTGTTETALVMSYLIKKTIEIENKIKKQKLIDNVIS